MLADSNEFKEATGGIKSDRMIDREFITRFLAFRIKPVSEYKPDMDTYMNQRMRELRDLPSEERESIRCSFICAEIGRASCRERV